MRLNFRVGLTEALSNAMMYGNGDDPTKRVRVEVTIKGTRIEARITDQGVGFDPGSVPDPTSPDNLLKSGGRGLFLMRQLCDEVSFNDQGNQVTLVLCLEQGVPLEGGAQA
jgi:serine/threonine-protein kinase RsbW